MTQCEKQGHAADNQGYCHTCGKPMAISDANWKVMQFIKDRHPRGETMTTDDILHEVMRTYLAESMLDRLKWFGGENGSVHRREIYDLLDVMDGE